MAPSVQCKEVESLRGGIWWERIRSLRVWTLEGVCVGLQGEEVLVRVGCGGEVIPHVWPLLHIAFAISASLPSCNTARGPR